MSEPENDIIPESDVIQAIAFCLTAILSMCDGLTPGTTMLRMRDGAVYVIPIDPDAFVCECPIDTESTADPLEPDSLGASTDHAMTMIDNAIGDFELSKDAMCTTHMSPPAVRVSIAGCGLIRGARR